MHISQSPEETKAIASSLAGRIQKGIVCLYGDLGAGKTIFAKGFAHHKGVPEQEIKSPTYTFVRQYNLGEQTLYHFDFYRIEALDDLMKHDLEEIFTQKNALILIEWPERVEPILPEKRTNVRLEYVDDHQRKIIITPER